MSTSQQNLDVVRAAISMARELNMTSVAEGVESASVYNFLIAHGCEEAQGYFIARPMSLADFEVFVSLPHDFAGSQIGRVHQACLNLMRFRKTMLDAAFCRRVGDGIALESIADPSVHTEFTQSRVGLWYFGMGQALVDLPVFREIEQPLRDVHASGFEFLQQLERSQAAGELDQALASIDRQVDHLVTLFHRLERLLLVQVER